ncbi:MAG TPA: hypothetical protein VKE94_16615 [Gemmataceae bacterium]|jgi:hypothetical protein|nr:hypothetical protein [Gemmataceae bacterium]
MLADPERMKRNIHEADTLDLMDRVTAFRQGLEPGAVALIEDELRQRGVSAEDLLAHAEQLHRNAIELSDGSAARCSICSRAAVARAWGWHRFWGVLPLFPRQYFYCAAHRPQSGEA